MRAAKRLALLSLSILLLLSGCWDYIDVEKLIIASGLAIDYDPQGKQYTLTAEVIDLSASMEGLDYQTKKVVGKGRTVAEAFSLLLATGGSKMYFGHAEVVVLSRSVAEEKIIEISDWFTHSTEVKMYTIMVMAETEKASEIFDLKMIEETSISYSISTLFAGYESNRGKRLARIYSFVNSFQTNESLGHMLVVGVDTYEEEAKEKFLAVKGISVFGNDKYAGTYTVEEIKYFTLMLGGKEDGCFSAVIDDGTEFVLTAMENSSKMSVKWEENHVKATINLHVGLSLVNIIGANIDFSTASFKEVAKAAEQTIKEGCEAVADKDVAEFHSDAFGVASAMRASHFKKWQEIKNSWFDIYPLTDFEINVVCDINLSGYAGNSVEEKGDKH